MSAFNLTLEHPAADILTELDGVIDSIAGSEAHADLFPDNAPTHLEAARAELVGRLAQYDSGERVRVVISDAPDDSYTITVTVVADPET